MQIACSVRGPVMHMLRTVRNKTHDTEALVHACSA